MAKMEAVSPQALARKLTEEIVHLSQTDAHSFGHVALGQTPFFAQKF